MKKNLKATVPASIMLAGSLAIGVLSAPAASAAPLSISAAVSSVVPASSYSDSFTKQTFDLMNAERAKVGSRPLVYNQQVAEVSQDWAEKLGVATMKSDFDWADIHRKDAGGSLIPSGATMYREIIGFNFTPAQIVDWWMNSPSHKAAMLHASATDAGLGYVVPTSGPYAGWHLVVSNLAGYTTTETQVPSPVPTPTLPTVPAAPTRDTLKAIDTAGTLWGYEVPGSPTLSVRERLGSGWHTAKQIISVDWDSDGKLDIVARWGNGYVTMYAGLGNDDYKAPVNIGWGWQNYEITATKLRNTDAYPGLVARDLIGGNLYYYPNANGRTFASRFQIGNGWGPMSELNALDFDGDKNMDIVARNSVGGLYLYRTNGRGAFISETRKMVGRGWQKFESITAEPDFDGPGTVGLVSSVGGRLLYYPIVNGSFKPYKTLGSRGWSGYKVAEGVPVIR